MGARRYIGVDAWKGVLRPRVLGLTLGETRSEEEAAVEDHSELSFELGGDPVFSVLHFYPPRGRRSLLLLGQRRKWHFCLESPVGGKIFMK